LKGVGPINKIWSTAGIPEPLVSSARIFLNDGKLQNKHSREGTEIKEGDIDIRRAQAYTEQNEHENTSQHQITTYLKSSCLMLISWVSPS